jgi:hypothetical protein
MISQVCLTTGLHSTRHLANAAFPFLLSCHFCLLTESCDNAATWEVPTALLDVTWPLIGRTKSPAHLWVANKPSNFAGGFPGHILQSGYRCYLFVCVMLSNTWANQDNNCHQTYGWGRHHVLHPWNFSSSYGDSCLARNLRRLTSRWLLF